MDAISQVFENPIIKNKIAKFLKAYSGKKICFYGAGRLAEKFISVYDLSGLNVLGFIDKNPEKSNKTIKNYTIHPIEDIQKLKPNVIVTTMLAESKTGYFLQQLGEYLKLDYEVIDDLFIELATTGERQVADNIEEIEPRHRQRYNFAAFYIDCYEKFYNKRLKLADIGCSIGYGSYIIATSMEPKKLDSINSFDIAEEAINFAQKYYSHPKIQFYNQDCLGESIAANDIFASKTYDAIVCFELLEHLEIEESKKLIDLLLKKSEVLISSLPIGEGSKFHKSSFNKQEIEDYYNGAIAHCSARKRVSHVFVQNDQYYVCVIENC